MHPTILWGLTLVGVVAVAGAALSVTLPVAAAFRVAAASVALLILPGLTCSLLVMPLGRTATAADWVQRLGLAFGLSLAIVSVVLLVLNRLGVRLTALSVIVSLAGVTVFPLLVRLVRRAPKA